MGVGRRGSIGDLEGLVSEVGGKLLVFFIFVVKEKCLRRREWVFGL